MADKNKSKLVDLYITGYSFLFTGHMFHTKEKQFLPSLEVFPNGLNAEVYPTTDHLFQTEGSSSGQAGPVRVGGCQLSSSST
ncbi:hypothetical protein EVAR_93546_1 [Eumeta japonica]|uniref:Uncharacterized protein n=1 Tax=Eumeta variegata TaxID=151549 RepID=A0A4C1USE7_EUMVA|nr:hypothetical protein EVAR_93546_1 [Eumeta japonica]